MTIIQVDPELDNFWDFWDIASITAKGLQIVKNLTQVHDAGEVGSEGGTKIDI